MTTTMTEIKRSAVIFAVCFLSGALAQAQSASVSLEALRSQAVDDLSVLTKKIADLAHVRKKFDPCIAQRLKLQSNFFLTCARSAIKKKVRSLHRSAAQASVAFGPMVRRSF